MKVEFRGKWYDFSEYFGVNVEKLSNEWFKYRWKNNDSPHLSVLPEYSKLTKELDEEEYLFLYAMCRGREEVRSFKRRPLKRVIQQSGKQPVFFVPRYKASKVQKTLRLDKYKVNFMINKLNADFSNSIYKLFDYWIEKEGLKEELFEYYKEDYYNS